MMQAYQMMPELPEEKKKRSIDFAIKAAWLAISKKYNAMGAEYDITHSTGFVLLNIDRELGTPATKIAPLMGMEARSLTRMLKTMEEDGIIFRETDDDDKRKVIIKLTERGKLKRELARQSVKALQGRIESQVPHEKLHVFFEVIDMVFKVLDELDTNAPEFDHFRSSQLDLHKQI